MLTGKEKLDKLLPESAKRTHIFTMKLQELQGAIMQLSTEKGIPKDQVVETVALALAAAYKKEYGDRDEKVEAVFDEKRSRFFVYAKKLVVSTQSLKNPDEAKEIALQEVKNVDRNVPITVEKGQGEKTSEEEEGEAKTLIKFKPQRHILLSEAKKLVAEAEVGDWLLFPLVEKERFGRIAAQTAKQVIIQKLRELEHSLAFETLKEKEGQIVSGIVQRVEVGTVWVDLGKSVGTLLPPDQLGAERYQSGQRIKVYVSKVEQGAKGPVAFLSRSSPKALSQMFSQEVPEIASGVVQLLSIAREAGSRSKIAVRSTDPEVDPIGSCVGQRGMRIAIIINEFNGEKIDIIPFSEDPASFIANALSPAKVLQLRIDDEKARKATAIVSEDQQSLAIGKKGQNVRLAAKLTGWKIDVRVPSELEKVDET